MEVGEETSALGQWRTVQRDANPRLRPFVHGYFASSSRLHRTVRELHLPSAEVPLMLNFGEQHRRLDANGSEDWSTRDGVWIVGLHDRHQVTEAAGEREFMVVRFTPLGAHLFLRLPMHLIANEALDLDLIDPPLARAVKGRVGAARAWADRFAAMDLLIAERMAEAERSRAIHAAWRRLVASDGRIAIGSLASEMDCSRRTMIERFRTQVGLRPKTMARLLRFNRAIRLLDTPVRRTADEPAGKPYIEADATCHRPAGAIQWADLAADCGYFDQAHFIREFQAFAGRTPAAFLRGIAA